MRKFAPFSICVVLPSLLCGVSRADLLDPIDFSSLAAGLDPNSTVVIDTGTVGDPNSQPSITIDGGSPVLGVIDD